MGIGWHVNARRQLRRTVSAQPVDELVALVKVGSRKGRRSLIGLANIGGVPRRACLQPCRTRGR